MTWLAKRPGRSCCASGVETAVVTSSSSPRSGRSSHVRGTSHKLGLIQPRKLFHFLERFCPSYVFTSQSNVAGRAVHEVASPFPDLAASQTLRRPTLYFVDPSHTCRFRILNSQIIN